MIKVILFHASFIIKMAFHRALISANRNERKRNSRVRKSETLRKTSYRLKQQKQKTIKTGVSIKSRKMKSQPS